MRNGRKRRGSSFEKPWVAYAAIGGIVIVVILALVFYLGGGSSPATSAGRPAAPVPAGTTAAAAATGSGQGTSATGSGAIVAGATPTVVIVTQAPVTVPATGVYVEVSYLGGFSGTYGTSGAMTTIRDSGNRLYSVGNATGIVTASFRKQDSSTTHELDVGIWKDGKAVISGRNQTSYGAVSISAAV
ncbi:MAG TPA: hypothetical protein VLY83_05830 [Methanoregula sp.]|nr:hypothetical protein [Methanoregula sp.]